MIALMKRGFTDIHTHILPSVDDGAQSMDAALELLRLEKDSGVQRVVLTPHFYPQTENLTDFLARREQSYTALMRQWDASTMPQLQLGAEVHYAPTLADMELEQLTLGNGKYLLLELPDNEIPAYAQQVVGQICRKGITPILAHVERCTYFRHQPELLLRLIQTGALGQISARAMQNKKDRGFVISCIENGLGHIVASDLHDRTGKDLCLGELAEGKYEELIGWTESFAEAVWNNAPLPPFAVRPIKQSIFGYR